MSTDGRTPVMNMMVVGAVALWFAPSFILLESAEYGAIYAQLLSFHGDLPGMYVRAENSRSLTAVAYRADIDFAADSIKDES
ncbi:hypothetical protein C8Q77DRAFT_1121473 [Trametes polyzona]|nr:hypothetical protein C8Q77DRAFT_1121473 [Trametes polyzona]